MNFTIYMPERADVEALQAGSTAIDAYGQLSTVARVTARLTLGDGRLVVTFETSLAGTGATLAGAYVEGELVLTMPVRENFSPLGLIALGEAFISRPD